MKFTIQLSWQKNSLALENSNLTKYQFIDMEFVVSEVFSPIFSSPTFDAILGGLNESL